MNKFIILIVILSTIALAVASSKAQEVREFRPLLPVSLRTSSILSEALKWEGKYYKKGVSFQCANWVGAVVLSAGGGRPNNHSAARSWLKWGKPVSSVSNIRPGDIVVTWRGSLNSSTGHILIYIGGGECIHRPTRSKEVQRINLAIYKEKILGIRRR